MHLHILGTSSMVPTKERNVSGAVLDRKGELILFDCGEGTQRQMNIAGLNRVKVRKILLSHWHGDHVAGLIGLLQTIGNSENAPPITIWGPKHSQERVNHLLAAIAWDCRADITVHDLDPQDVMEFYENDEYVLSCAPLEHSTPVLAYSLREKDKLRIETDKLKKYELRPGPLVGRLQRGETITHNSKRIRPEDVARVQHGRKLSVVADTRMCQSAIDIANGADLLLIESTYESSKQEQAHRYKHLTVRDACQIAQLAGVKRLVLTHFSQRYKTVEKLEEEAQTYFPNVACAYDFMKVKL